MESFLINTLIPLAVGALWEYFLGKTKSIDANSSIELVTNLYKKIRKK